MKSASVLCVEPRSECLYQIKSVLEDAGYNVVCAQTGAEAILKFWTGKFDGVLLEYDLPDIPGSFVRDQILRLKPALPIILITGGEAQIAFLVRFFKSFVLPEKGHDRDFVTTGS